MIEITRADMHETDPRAKISEIFVAGFYQWLRYFSKDRQKLAGALAHMFNLDVFYIGVTDGQIAGIAALSGGDRPAVTLDRKEFRKHLGFIRGSIACKVLKGEFMDKKYPIEHKPGTAYVEMVATSPEFRKKGVAGAIITYFFSLPGYSEYVLEAADTNENAVRLYEKLGFREFSRVEMKHKKQSGINFLLYMKYAKEP